MTMYLYNLKKNSFVHFTCYDKDNAMQSILNLGLHDKIDDLSQKITSLYESL